MCSLYSTEQNDFDVTEGKEWSRDDFCKIHIFTV